MVRSLGGAFHVTDRFVASHALGVPLRKDRDSVVVEGDDAHGLVEDFISIAMAMEKG